MKLKIGEFSQLVGVPVKRLQYLDNIGFYKVKRTLTNRRIYEKEDIETFKELNKID